jgi:prolyl-tRNA synthetase
VVEANHDERGIIWPAELAPPDVHLVALNPEREAVSAAAERLFVDLQAKRSAGPLRRPRGDGRRQFNDADLLGMPWRVTVSPCNAERGEVELKRRMAKEFVSIAIDGAGHRHREGSARLIKGIVSRLNQIMTIFRITPTRCLHGRAALAH